MHFWVFFIFIYFPFKLINWWRMNSFITLGFRNRKYSSIPITQIVLWICEFKIWGVAKTLKKQKQSKTLIVSHYKSELERMKIFQSPFEFSKTYLFIRSILKSQTLADSVNDFWRLLPFLICYHKQNLEFFSHFLISNYA